MNAVTAVTAVRQGDILLIKMGSAPAGLERKATKNGQVTVGYGEVTGHHHTIQDAVWLVAPDITPDDLHQFAMGNRPDMPVFVVADEPTTLTHQEHSPIALDAGVWQVVRQRTYSPERIISVRD